VVGDGWVWWMVVKDEVVEKVGGRKLSMRKRVGGR
jgi:hypothetical protein